MPWFPEAWCGDSRVNSGWEKKPNAPKRKFSVTKTIPRRDSDSPLSPLLPPAKFPPPGIHTITGFDVLLGHSGVQIFRYRQSSFEISAAFRMRGVEACMQIAPKV